MQKLLVIGALALLLTIPLILITSLVYERQGRFKEAVRNVGDSWSQEQNVTGPFLVIPFKRLSTWPDPSFTGALLPDSHAESAQGFRAIWRVSHLARAFPQYWSSYRLPDTSISKLIDQSSFGAALFNTVGPYRSVIRSLKYAILFIGFTFLTFLLFELQADLRIHPVQYLSVGSALCTFYLLLLALAEHFGFGAGYTVATVATVCLLSAYSKVLLGAGPRSWTLTGLLLVLYGLLYLLLQLEDYALLVGSLAVFAGLAAFMYLTRAVDWYSAYPRTRESDGSSLARGAVPGSPSEQKSED